MSTNHNRFEVRRAEAYRAEVLLLTSLTPYPLVKPAHSHRNQMASLLETGEEWDGVSRFGLAVRRQAGKQRDLGSNPLQLTFLFKSCGHCLVTLFLTINETLKWLLSLPILMRESFWW